MSVGLRAHHIVSIRKKIIRAEEGILNELLLFLSGGFHWYTSNDSDEQSFEGL